MPSREKLFIIDALTDAGMLAVFLVVAVCFNMAIQFLVGNELLGSNSVPFYCIIALTAIIEIIHSMHLADIVVERTWNDLRDRWGHSKARDRAQQSSEGGFNLTEAVVQWYKRNPLHKNELVWATTLLVGVVTGVGAVLHQDLATALVYGFGSFFAYLLLIRW